MADVKQLLKEAKTELGRGDYEEARDLSLKVLKSDKDNYFAHVFLGKCYSMLSGGLKDAVHHYKCAIEINRDSVLAWKGLFLLFKNEPLTCPDIVSFNDYYVLSGKYAEVLIEQELPLVELIEDIKIFRRVNPASEEALMRNLVPGKQMAEKLGRYILSPIAALTKLIDILNKKEQEQISQIVSKERLKMTTSDPHFQIKINGLSWAVYSDSEIDDLYNQLINILDDDVQRSMTEESWLKYRLRVLRSMPQSMKSLYFAKVKTMVDDLVLVDHNSLDAWKLYFEWQDFVDVDNMPLDQILKFFKKFPTEPLSVILYSWVSSKYSKFDNSVIQEFMKDISPSNKNKKEDANGRAYEEQEDEEDDELKNEDVQAMMDQPDDIDGLLEEDILQALMENIKKSKTSILAHRIVTYYYLLSKEYEAALPYVRNGISLVAYNVKDLGYAFNNSKRDFRIALGTIYTYVDAPKNHDSALSLFDKVLLEEPENNEAKMGKGLIFMERENWQEAYVLLKAVAEEFSEKWDVISELGWCQVKLGEYHDAIDKFKLVLQNIVGMDLRSQEFRALNYWRLAETYIYLQKDDPSDSEFSSVKTAYKILIQSIKSMDTYAPSFCSVGYIYAKYFNDPARAFKCHYRAFELDAGNIISAEYLAKTYTEAANWTLASEIAERLVKSEKAKKHLRNTSWPFNVLGFAHLEKQRDAESIQWFQQALSIDQNDSESWIGLGQAYLNCGRIEAAWKVFEKVIQLDPTHIYAPYFKAQCHALLGEYSDGLSLLAELTKKFSEVTVFKVYDAILHVDYSIDLFHQGYLSKSVAEAENAIMKIEMVLDTNQKNGQQIWIALYKAIRLFSQVQSSIDRLPVESIINIFQKTTDFGNNSTVEDIEDLTIESILEKSDNDNVKVAASLLVLSSKYALLTQFNENSQATVNSSLWCNMGLAELTYHCLLNDDSFRDKAVKSFKRAIQYQSNNLEAWVGLGISTMDMNFRVSQHCFIKASALAPRDPTIWVALAMLALKYNDLEFAQTVMNKAQSIAPSDSSPWLGLALIKEKNGLQKESAGLFSHSFVLSNGRSSTTQILFSKSVLNMHIRSGNDESNVEAIEQLTLVANALEQYFKKIPNDPFAIQCALLCYERLKYFRGSASICEKMVNILETRYEESGDDQELYNFALFKTQLARIQLGTCEYESSIENALMSQDILNDYDTEEAKSAIISNSLCLGLSYYFTDSLDESIEFFQKLLVISKESRIIIALISKVLYDVGSEESREIALQELIDYISENGSDLLVTSVFSAMSLVERKNESLEILRNTINELKPSDWIADKKRNIPYLMRIIDQRQSGEDKSDISQRAAFFFPNQNNVWKTLCHRIERRVASDDQNKVSAKLFSDMVSNERDLRSIQRSIFLSPSNSKAYTLLNECF
ncbi:Superkiller protein 3 [Nakaseomyces bracarensis]|uniref:Superkiller protein 3 n=1 Tax=Nakaseomyces bracarensis TaxID=273131 RepID=A0ABR4NZQ4_9SACH